MQTNTISSMRVLPLLTLLSFGAVLYGQAGSSVTVYPAQLTFDAQGGSAAAQNLVVYAAGTTGTFTAAATSTGNWLSVTPGTGTAPQIVSVSVTPGSLTPGAYGGYVTITSGNTSTIVPVVLNVNSGGMSPLTATPGTLTFGFQSGSSVPQTQQISLAMSGGGTTSFTTTPSTSNGGTWLTVTPSSGTTPSNLSISVNPAGLQPGTYNGSIAVNVPGSTGLLIPVQVSVAAAATLNVAPQQLSFAFQMGTNAPSPQTLTLTSAGDTPLTFTATPSTTTCGSNWLVVQPQTSATPSTVSVQINTTGLQAGNCTGTINISAPSASNATISVPVSLLVSTNPLLQVPTAGNTFNYQLGTGTPSAQTVQVTSSSTPLPFTVTAAPVGNGPHFVTVTPSSGTTPQAVALGIDPAVLAGLAPNTYVENVTVASPSAGNPSQTFAVTLNVSNTPTLISSQEKLSFNYQIGQTAPQSQTFTVSSNGAPLSYNVSAASTNCPNFVSVTPASGTTAFQSGQQSQVVAVVKTAGLSTPKTCNGTITLTAPGSTAAPLHIPVTLNVSNTPLIELSPAALNIIALPGAALSTQQIFLTSTDGTTSLNFTATAATTPPGLTWLSVAPNTGNSPSSLTVTINPANLPIGVYKGSIDVSSTSTGVPAQSIPVTLTIASGSVTPTPAALTFNQPTDSSVPGSQTVTIAGVPQGSTIGAMPTYFNGTNWLNVSTSGNTITVAPAGPRLGQGSYSGVITVFVPGAANSPLYIPVTYTVGGVSVFTAVPGTVTFNYQTGTTIPPAQNVQLSSPSGAINWNAVAALPPGTANNVVFVTVGTPTGTTPGNLSIGLNQTVVNTLSPGTYTNVVNLTSPSAPGSTQPLTVTLNVTAAGQPSVTGVVNAASYQIGAVAPGELVSIFGSNIGPATPGNLTVGSDGKVTTTNSGVSVTFNGFPAPLTYVGTNQINAIVPYELANTTTATVVVTNNGTPAAPFQVSIQPTAPAVFTSGQNGSGQAAILNADFSVNSTTNAASRGSAIAIYGTGAGLLNPLAETGSVTPSTGTNFSLIAVPGTTVMIGGVPAQVVYAGAAPGLVSGVFQINAVIPSTVSAGVQPVVVTIGGTSSPAVATVAVKE